MAEKLLPGITEHLRTLHEDTAGPRRSPAPSVLVADSDPLSRYIIGTTLRDSGMVLAVTTVDAGRPLREWRLGGVEVVLWSIGPGTDVSRQVRALASRNIRVLLLSTRWTAGGIRAALAAGAVGLLNKDAEPDRLVVAVSAAVAGYTLVNSGLDAFASPADHTGHDGTGSDAQPCRPDTARPDPAQELLNLSDREFEVLSQLASGRSTEEVAQLLAIKTATVKSHISHLLAKLQVRNRVEAVLLYQRVIAQHTSSIAMDARASPPHHPGQRTDDRPRTRIAS
ncbi:MULTISPECIES: helix-turn-helix transcriptional regulator [Streptomyces]|uniref:helix-turn-helix transcriptional regulator n=1 Tax=Streptomyces TaxID=1883 RepID=UPI00068E9567|nr:LuxR C-terminal-related transcriptional regulator [Streptomyces sp. NRRL S-1868]